jgi:dihydroorotase
VVGLDRGTLTPGKAGDVTVLSLDREWTFDVNETQSKSKNSPFDGWRFRGGPVATIVAGKLVWQARVSVPA